MSNLFGAVILAVIFSSSSRRDCSRMDLLSMKSEARERGASVIEFAVVLPLLLIIFAGIVEFGIILYDKAVLTNAAREGSEGIVLLGKDAADNPIRVDDDIVESVVTDYCNGRLLNFGSGTPATVDVDVNYTSQAILDDLQVHAEYVYSYLLVPNFLPFLNSTLTLQANVTMRYE